MNARLIRKAHFPGPDGGRIVTPDEVIPLDMAAGSGVPFAPTDDPITPVRGDDHPSPSPRATPSPRARKPREA